MIPPLSDALAERGYDSLTPVQEAVTDPSLADADLLVSAQTGSGKTVGFGLAIAPTLLGEAHAFGPAAAPRALVIAPTRELAMQVKHELGWLYAKTGARIASCVGGMDMRDERRALERGAHIVVGTPGRLRDHIERGSLDLGTLRAAVLDEADEMLDLGFREDLEFILEAAPPERRTLLFSATVPPMIEKLAGEFQRDARRINTLGGTTQHADIAYQALRVAPQDSEHAIFNLLRYHDEDSALVFANTRATVNHLTARLANRGFSVVSLSGELSQSERSHALQAMRDGRARVCVATDVAARGIDLPRLTLVIHADLPTNTESLLHRSGRTGRAGHKGISALIVPPKMTKRAERLLKWAKITAEWTNPPTAEMILARDEERLLNDPDWSTEPSEAEVGFATRLLATQPPEAIAAAYLRLYRARRSAPEDLLPPDTRPEKRERKPFGPSRWIALSVGRDDRAEPRWILPLLLRAGDFDKSAIGAIRVTPKETFVELSEPVVEGFLARLGDNGELEKGVTARPADGPPPAGPRGPKPHRGKGPRPVSKPDDTRHDGPKPRAKTPAEAKPRKEAPSETPEAKPAGKPKGKPWEKEKGKAGGKPKGKPWEKSSTKGGDKPKSKPGKTPFRKGTDTKPGDKSWARDPSKKPTGKPRTKPGASAARGKGPKGKGGHAAPRRPK